MGILFISHSSRNNDRAIQVRDWLREQGWRDTFLDLDPEHGLAPGQRWQEELKKAGARCSAVIVLVSPDWVASRWCVTEFQLATMLDKPVFPVLIAPTPFPDLPHELTAHFQMADMSRPEIEADGLNSLRFGLTRAGLHPGHFPWPPPGEPKRPPYRGLHTLEEPDAAIFFGRDALIAKGLEALRRMRAGAPERMLVVLGASGAGKSSFLRAGLLARLQRDEESFLVLPLLRPARAALSGPTGLAHALGLSGPFTAAAMAARFAALRAPVVDRLTRYARAGREIHTARPPTLILPIDQGEELFAAEQMEAGAAFVGLAAAFAADENLLAIVTIRSDSFAALQAERTLAAIPRVPLDLPALSPASFKEVVEGPGCLAQPPIRVKPALTEQLVADLDRADALPLLAFTLERLFQDHGADGVLTLEEYRTGLGGLDGAIGKAVEAAFAAALEDDHLPGDRAELERLARSAFIPWLVRLERADAVPQRRVAVMRELPATAEPLVRHFINQRLLVSADREDGETTVEVPHEAVLRHWQLLADWLVEEGEELARCESVMRAAGDWRRGPSRAGEQADLLLVHRGERLTKADRLLERDDLAKLIGADARAYLAACREAETAALEKDRRQLRRQKRWQRFAGAAVLTAFVVMLIGAWLVLRGQQDLSRQRSLFLASMGHGASDAGRFDQAQRLSILAARDTWRQPASPEGSTELGRSSYFSRMQAVLFGHTNNVHSAVFAPDGTGVVTASADNTARVWRQGADGAWTATVLEGHTDAVRSAAFSPDGTHIVTASFDKTARLWQQGADGAWIASVLEGHDGFVSAAFSPDGASIVTWSFDDTARVWRQGADGAWAATVLEEHIGPVYSAAFSPDGTCIVIASLGSARVWRRGADGAWTATVLKGHTDAVRSAAFSPDGTHIVTASNDKTARAWRRVADGAWTATVLEGHGGLVSSAAFSPDGTRIVTASTDNTARVWRPGADGVWTATVLEGHTGAVWSAAFSSDGTRVVTASDDKTARVWRQGADGAWTATVLAGHTDAVWSAAFSPDGTRIVSASADSTTRVWRQGADGAWAATALEDHTGAVWSAAFSSDGTRIVTASDDKTARVWQQGADGAWAATVLKSHIRSVNSAAFSPDGTRIVTASHDKTARVWRQGADRSWTATVLEGHEGLVSSATFSPDGTRIVTASFDGTARVWQQGADGAWAATVLEGHSGAVRSAAFSHDGTRIVTASRDNTARVWRQSADGAWAATVLEEHTDAVISAAFSHDGTCIVTASADNTARVWQQGADGVWAATVLKGHTDAVISAAFSPNGTRIVTASHDKTARVWRQGADGAWAATILEGHDGMVSSAAFSPDGTSIITASFDKAARLWRQGADGAWTATLLEAHTDVVHSAAFSPDGTRIVTASHDKTARLWEVTWLIGDAGRAWANARNPNLHLKPLAQATCAEKLGGTERILLDHAGNEIGRESIRRLTKADTDAATILRGREGEDVCVWQPSFVDRLLSWIFRDVWHELATTMPPPS